MNEKNRTLSKADIDAIAEALRQTVVKEFYQNLGKGIWGTIWRAVVFIGLGIAAYGAAKGIK